MCVCTKRVCVSNTEPKTSTVDVSYKQCTRILVFVQYKRVNLFIVNCILKNKFNIHVYTLFIHLSQHYKPNFHAKNIIWLKFTKTTRYSSLIIIDDIVLQFLDWSVCTKRVCVCNNELVCKALRLASSCQTSAISLPCIFIPWHKRVTGSIELQICTWLEKIMIILGMKSELSPSLSFLF